MGAYGKYENRIRGNTGAIIFIPVYLVLQALFLFIHFTKAFVN